MYNNVENPNACMVFNTKENLAVSCEKQCEWNISKYNATRFSKRNRVANRIRPKLYFALIEK